MAKIKCDRADADPITNENPANTSPKIATNGKIVDTSLSWTLDNVDSTLAIASSGQRVKSPAPKSRINNFFKFI